jgi:ATP-binding cassette subfamily B protein
MAMVMVRGLLPILTTITTALLVAAATSPAPTRTALLITVLAASGSYAALIAGGPLQQAMAASLDSRLWGHVRFRFARRLLAPTGIGHLEEDALQGAIARGRGDGWNPLRLGDVSGQLGSIASGVIAFAGALAILGRFRLWAALAVGGAWLVSRLLTAMMTSRDLAVREAHDEESRRSAYVERLLVDLPAAKEVRLFGLPELFVGRLRDLVRSFSEARIAGRRRWLPLALALVIIVAGADLLVVAAVFHGIASGTLGPAQVALYGQALLQAVAATGSISFGTWGIRYAREFVIPILDLDRRPELAGGGTGAGDLAEAPRRAIRLEGVGFGYPGRDERVLDGLDLTLEAGRSTAVVGVNGAGKSTLIRILTRMYEPLEGRITVDGIDLGEIDAASWRRQLAVLSQGYSRYQLTVLENIGFGAGEQWDDRAAARRAAANAGVLSLIESMPQGWESTLSRLYPGGRDLSGGQWQRLALARALRAVEAGATVLILDEPTAELDVRAEAELFDRFLDLTRGLTTILISHRFSTVRRADRICVLDRGRITEQGTHAELLELGGAYDRMFTLQARHFREDADGV